MPEGVLLSAVTTPAAARCRDCARLPRSDRSIAALTPHSPVGRRPVRMPRAPMPFISATPRRMAIRPHRVRRHGQPCLRGRSDAHGVSATVTESE